MHSLEAGKIEFLITKGCVKCVFVLYLSVPPAWHWEMRAGDVSLVAVASCSVTKHSFEWADRS